MGQLTITPMACGKDNSWLQSNDSKLSPFVLASLKTENILTPYWYSWSFKYLGILSRFFSQKHESFGMRIFFSSKQCKNIRLGDWILFQWQMRFSCSSECVLSCLCHLWSPFLRGNKSFDIKDEKQVGKNWNRMTRNFISGWPWWHLLPWWNRGFRVLFRKSRAKIWHILIFKVQMAK